MIRNRARLFLVAACLLALAASSHLVAQSSASLATAEVQLTREVIRMQRRALVASNLPLTAAESKAFWPVFGEYRSERTKIEDRWAAHVTDYATRQQSLTDEEAKALLDAFLEIREQEVQLLKKYARRFLKVVPARKVARFYQIENKLDAAIDMELAGKIPLLQ